MVTWKLAKLQRADDLKIYVQHFTLVMHAYKFFRLASLFLSTAFAAIEGDIENGDNSRQVKHKGFFFISLCLAFELKDMNSEAFVHVTVHLLIKHTISVFSAQPSSLSPASFDIR